MSVVYPVTLINSRLQVVETAIDAGGSPGNLKLLDSGGNTLSTLQMAIPSGTVAAGVLTFQGMSLVDPAAAASGVASLARIEDSTGAAVITGLTVGPPAATADIVLSPTNTIVAGQTIAITAGTITGH